MGKKYLKIVGGHFEEDVLPIISPAKGGTGVDSLDKVELSRYQYVGVRNANNGRLLRGTETEHLNLDDYCKPSMCGCYSIYWEDVNKGYVNGLPNWTPSGGGGFAANLDVICDYNDDSLQCVHQTLRIRTNVVDHNESLLIFYRMYSSGQWTSWLKAVSHYELNVLRSDIQSGDTRFSAPTSLASNTKLAKGLYIITVAQNSVAAVGTAVAYIDPDKHITVSAGSYEIAFYKTGMVVDGETQTVYKTDVKYQGNLVTNPTICVKKIASVS